MAQPVAEVAPRQYLTFSAGGEELAVELLRIREILQPGAITRVPMAPAWARGVMNLRGSVLPVIDLSSKLGLGESALDRRTCIMVVEVDLGEGEEELVLGVLVDAVRQVVELSAAEIEEPPAFGVPIHLDYLGGMGRVGEALVLLLDVDRVLSEEELRMASSLEAPAAGETAGEAGEQDGGAEAP